MTNAGPATDCRHPRADSRCHMVMRYIQGLRLGLLKREAVNETIAKAGVPPNEGPGRAMSQSSSSCTCIWALRRW